ncbi:MAG TPA: hypothetical protein VJ813_19665 [Vicinamibacterales bacterium]|nr:hypothetical protein [Vicinamibacterales bacterium]
MRRFLVVLILVLAPATAGAQQSVTVRDIIELSKAGLGEEALLALIDVNQPIFPVDAETLKVLKAAGVAPRVIVAMIKSGRTAPVLPPEPVEPPAPAASEPPVVVVEHHHETPVVREVPVPVPVYITVPSRRVHRVIDGHSLSRPVVHPKAVEPVYWGWGGKLRPDAWKTAADVQKDARVPREPQKK